MISITIDASAAYPLVDQIVAGIRRQIDERCLRPGTKLPSIRQFAAAYGVSRFTVWRLTTVWSRSATWRRGAARGSSPHRSAMRRLDRKATMAASAMRSWSGFFAGR